MRGFLVAFVSHAAVSLWAQDSLSYQPIYMNATAIRSLQGQSGSKVPRLGLFGLSQPAAARFGWDRVQNDSAFAFDAAKTLWLDYYCLFGDSLSADWALVESPREVLKRKDLKPWNLMPRQNSPLAKPLPPLAFGGNLRLPSITSDSPKDVAAAVLPTNPPSEINSTEIRILVRSGDNFGILQRRHPELASRNSMLPIEAVIESTQVKYLKLGDESPKPLDDFCLCGIAAAAACGKLFIARINSPAGAQMA